MPLFLYWSFLSCFKQNCFIWGLSLFVYLSKLAVSVYLSEISKASTVEQHCPYVLLPLT
jgi:hypothetical protein